MRKDKIRWVRLDLEYKNSEEDCKVTQDNDDSAKDSASVEVSGVFNRAILVELSKIHSICFGRMVEGIVASVLQTWKCSEKRCRDGETRGVCVGVSCSR